MHEGSRSVGEEGTIGKKRHPKASAPQTCLSTSHSPVAAPFALGQQQGPLECFLASPPSSSRYVGVDLIQNAALALSSSKLSVRHCRHQQQSIRGPMGTREGEEDDGGCHMAVGRACP